MISKITTRELFLQLNELDEQEDLEAKSQTKDSSRSLLETVCSFSNEPGLGGGTILLGIAENETCDGDPYVVEGVGDPDKAQRDLATQCKGVFNHPVFPDVRVEKLNGKTVLRISVHELEASQKPLYFKKDDLPRGAYRRVGSADLRCTGEDIGELFSDPSGGYDQMPVKGATLQDVDEQAVKRYRELRRQVNPTALIFMREAGAIDNPAYRQICGCETLKASYELRRLREAGIIMLKGRGTATYYVPKWGNAVTSEESLAQSMVGSEPSLVCSKPSLVCSKPSLVCSEPSLVGSEPSLVCSEPSLVGSVSSTMPETDENLMTTARNAQKRLKKSNLEEIIYQMCLIRALEREEIARFISRTDRYVRLILKDMIGKRLLRYKYPEMIKHPHQAYIAIPKGGEK